MSDWKYKINELVYHRTSASWGACIVRARGLIEEHDGDGKPVFFRLYRVRLNGLQGRPELHDFPEPELLSEEEYYEERRQRDERHARACRVPK